MGARLEPQFTPAAATDVVAPWAVLRADGQLEDGADPPLGHAEVREALRWMLLSRAFDTKAFSLQRQGRFGTFSPVRGQEASVVGCAMALDPVRDWVVPQYRELPALLRQGLPLDRFMLYFLGNPAGGGIPEDVNVLPIQISLAAQLPHAVGLAWGLRRRGADGVVMVFVGDGASSEGDFHESLNLAGLQSAPVVFVVQNNGWAISTPRARQSAGRTLAERGPAYGMPGIVVDGNDLLATYAAASFAVERARAGEGPTVIESLTYRIGPHNTADDPSRYIDEEVHERWAALDPIDRVERYLTAHGAWDEQAAEETARAIDAEIDAAWEAATASHAPHVGQLFDHVYAEDTARLQRQRQALTGSGGIER
jgi:pyruvate dehydrogenase E1 component alpha subunit